MLEAFVARCQILFVKKGFGLVELRYLSLHLDQLYCLFVETKPAVCRLINQYNPIFLIASLNQ